MNETRRSFWVGYAWFGVLVALLAGSLWGFRGTVPSQFVGSRAPSRKMCGSIAHDAFLPDYRFKRNQSRNDLPPNTMQIRDVDQWSDYKIILYREDSNSFTVVKQNESISLSPPNWKLFAIKVDQLKAGERPETLVPSDPRLLPAVEPQKFYEGYWYIIIQPNKFILFEADRLIR
jgi:hypothetical protein